ncbi:tRNA uridine-5-carboxymethylaminomethyl(34) synthesis enzyme MnmG [Helicobacter sp. 11S02629-2]|uniref:tRNA uridine-5-carboxymethylaminomethyl modification enzyme MnmG/GidA n=1 Tax=Helicobacter sp. 11S02629-2 TaxID=1476195 RepID=UPI000BA56FC3|nr:tRNA uridine-5-carboxymethylaminomethyl(34) synthesis enzyme MnmG [Helicobacter sp. 11S02629-2]PAF45923.1 tRNA uridine-5-carboxymethylaminomethyl(34) synthesis enzyme MnmG [Helicobacter sp. 11S02629-2]
MSNEYDVIVVGGGHAGVEASFMSAKLGAKTLLITQLIDNIALASCNPAIGGLGKGHLVKEVDALGGLMGIITDISGLQYRILNASKGPAVRGTRAQIDMDIYKATARDILCKTPNLFITQGEVIEVLEKDGTAYGVKTALQKSYLAQKVIITSGTFLKGLIHIGENKSSNGRAGEGASNALSDSLKKLGIPLSRLKTGTCPRILGSSIDKSGLEQHHGDEVTPFFSLRLGALLEGIKLDGNSDSLNAFIDSLLKKRIVDSKFSPISLPCYVTYTNETTHKLIESNFHRAPLFTGQIEGVGPRYCPSIEDKINRFREKERHQLFIEPQTINASEYYINGLSTSLPYDVQEEIIASLPGLKNAHITRFGYAIEYDFSQPLNLKHTLESKIVKNLYLAGQINGTTGYEEAAAQGLMAGLNASLSLQTKSFPLKEVIFTRSEGYIGVMIDDLVTKGTNEPYRVFTSRAEHRLLLREDNACFRMKEVAFKLKLLDEKILDRLKQDESDYEANVYLVNETITPSKETLQFLDSIGEEPIANKTILGQVMKRDSMSLEKLKLLNPAFKQLSNRTLEQLQIFAKYDSYIQKQVALIARSEKTLKLKIPSDFRFEGISSLGLEARQKLSEARPTTLKEASLISGITPADIEVLELYITIKHKSAN